MNNMYNSEWQPSVEDILDAYLSENPNPSKETLKKWIQAYPQFEQELTDLTVASSVSNSLPPQGDAQKSKSEQFVLYGMSVLHDLLHQIDDQVDQDGESAIAGIVAEGLSLGYKSRDLAELIEVTPTILAKFDRRLFIFRSIPILIIQRLAMALQKPYTVISAYLEGVQTSAIGARHRSEQLPTLQEQEDFFEAVRNDPMLGEAQRQKLLDLQSVD